MKITVFCEWENHAVVRNHGKAQVLINAFDASSDWVVDLCTGSRSALAAKYPPHKRIYVAGEPTPYMPFDRISPELFAEFYQGAIFAWHKPFQAFSQTKPFGFGTSWVTWDPDPLRFGISGVFSGKSNRGLPGYEIRKKIIEEEKRVKIPGVVYSPKGIWKQQTFTYPLPTKRPALRTMFHWAVENIQEKGYFTEKLIDCLVCGVVPVYFGDPAVSKYFDERGIIRLDVGNIAGQANTLTVETYEKMKPYVEENRRRAQSYRHLIKNVVAHINQYLLGNNEGLPRS